MLDWKESEIELRDQLASRFRQFGSDRLIIFEARNIVATKASVAADQAFAREQILLIRSHAFQLFARFDVG